MDSQITTASEKAAPIIKKHNVSKILCIVFFFVASLALFAAIWYTRTYGVTGFDSIIFTLFSNLNGVQSDLVLGITLNSVIPSVLVTAVLGFLFYFNPKKSFRIFPIKRTVLTTISLILSGVMLISAGMTVRLFSYLVNMTHQSTVFDEEYVDPDSVSIKFPEKKRNLIYIFLESMETTFFSKEQGGAIENCLTPELYSLAEKNINFSHNDGIGGFLTPNGTTWTVAAMTAQVSGIPLKAPSMFERNAYGSDSFLPGATTLTDILNANGYYQALMFGSDDVFANRDVLFKSHGLDQIYDLDTAREDGLIDPDYFVWWGMEDSYLFDYAKDKISEISKMDRPFAFTMLTVDTHHVAGYKCDKCDDKYEEQYDNVISCASRQVSDFIKWLKRQRFYKDTTVVIVGDHLTMDADYVKRNIDPEYEQHVYNCILNSAVEGNLYKNRRFSGMDMFPTTLAALGCEIPGNRLGLGTNLFSYKPTLIEEMGYDEFNNQLSKNSSYYNSNFILN